MWGEQVIEQICILGELMAKKFALSLRAHKLLKIHKSKGMEKLKADGVLGLSPVGVLSLLESSFESYLI